MIVCKAINRIETAVTCPELQNLPKYSTALAWHTLMKNIARAILVLISILVLVFGYVFFVPFRSGYVGKVAVSVRAYHTNALGQTQAMLVVTNPGRDRHGLALQFEDRAGANVDQRHRFAVCDVPALGETRVHVSMVPPRRGWHAVPTLVMETVFPFGLFRAWTVWRPAVRVLAWPRPEQPAPPLPVSASSPGDDRPTRRGAGGELDGVRPWRRGDTMRQVVWKKVARSGELVSRETAGSAQRELWLNWADAHHSDVEKRLSRLAAWVLWAEREGMAFGMQLPGHTLALGEGQAQRRDALERLATWP